MRRRWPVIAGIMLVITATLGIVFQHDGHSVFWWHHIPAFDFLYGVAGCIGLIVAAKWLGHAWLERHEDYYENEAP
jgi:di/tricarboxylate transporter